MTVIWTTEQHGFGSQIIEIQLAKGRGFAGIHLVGNVAEACRDSVERVKVVLANHGVTLPQRRIVLSFSPSVVRKQSTHFDLPLALVLLKHLQNLSFSKKLSRWVFAGEMGLDGTLRGMGGVIPAALAAQSAGFQGIVSGISNTADMLAIKRSMSRYPEFQVRLFAHFEDVLDWLHSTETGPQIDATESLPLLNESVRPTFRDMHLNQSLVRVAQVWAVGRHSIHLQGSPGCGKSMFAQRLPSLLPALSEQHFDEVMRIHGAHHQPLEPAVNLGFAPFRQPHHQASSSALLGSSARVGELALAHRGVLFLDEVTEFRRDVLEALRQPIESGVVHVSRANAAFSWPCELILIAASNPCPCGWSDSTIRLCDCSSQSVSAYRRRLSGPLLDRIDLQINMPEWKDEQAWFGLMHPDPKVPVDLNPTLQCGVQNALLFQAESREQLVPNSQLSMEELLTVCGQTGRTIDEWSAPCVQRGMSRRKIVRATRVARTLADLDTCPEITREHFLEAVGWSTLGSPSTVLSSQHKPIDNSLLESGIPRRLALPR